MDGWIDGKLLVLFSEYVQSALTCLFTTIIVTIPGRFGFINLGEKVGNTQIH